MEMGSVDDGSLLVQAQPAIPGAWVLSGQLITPAGRPASSRAGHPGLRGARSSPAQACNDYIESLHLRQTVTYQPASRYWAFQWYETAIYLAVALALAGFCFWWIRRDRSAELNSRRARPSPPVLALRR